jgi:hypothetical protein
MTYPYRECRCGNQIHTGGRYQCRKCDELDENPQPPAPAVYDPQDLEIARGFVRQAREYLQQSNPVMAYIFIKDVERYLARIAGEK